MEWKEEASREIGPPCPGNVPSTAENTGIDLMQMVMQICGQNGAELVVCSLNGMDLQLNIAADDRQLYSAGGTKWGV